MAWSAQLCEDALGTHRWKELLFVGSTSVSWCPVLCLALCWSLDTEPLFRHSQQPPGQASDVWVSFICFLPLLTPNKPEFGGAWHLLHNSCVLESVLFLHYWISPSGKLQTGDGPSLVWLNKQRTRRKPQYFYSDDMFTNTREKMTLSTFWRCEVRSSYLSWSAFY
jgi:hypothetical protein